MRISDWSSDVCSSDLAAGVFQQARLFEVWPPRGGLGGDRAVDCLDRGRAVAAQRMQARQVRVWHCELRVAGDRAREVVPRTLELAAVHGLRAEVVERRRVAGALGAEAAQGRGGGLVRKGGEWGQGV